MVKNGRKKPGKTAMVKMQIPPQPSEQLIDKQTAPILHDAKAIDSISSEDAFTYSGTLIPRIDTALKWMEAVGRPYTQGLDKMHKAGVAWLKGKMTPLANEKARLLTLRMQFREAEERRKNAASQKLALGLQKQAKRELERQARFEDKQGNAEAAETLREQAANVSLPQIAPGPAVPQQAGFYVKERWVYRIVDAARVEREWCSPDDKLIRPHVEAMGPACGISGIVVEREKKEHSRSVA